MAFATFHYFCHKHHNRSENIMLLSIYEKKCQWKKWKKSTSTEMSERKKMKNRFPLKVRDIEIGLSHWMTLWGFICGEPRFPWRWKLAADPLGRLCPSLCLSMRQNAPSQSLYILWHPLTGRWWRLYLFSVKKEEHQIPNIVARDLADRC